VKEGAAALQKRFGPVIEYAKKAGELAFMLTPTGMSLAMTKLACKTLSCSLPKLVNKGSKTAQGAADLATDVIPVVSTIKDGCACISGENPVLGEKVSGVEQGISCASAAIDIASYIAAIPTGGASVAGGVAAKQGLKTGLKATIKALLKKGGKEVAEEIVEKGAKELAEKAAKEVAEEIVEKGAKELAEKAAKEAAEKAAKEAAEKGIKEAAEKVAKETAEKEAKEVAEKAAKQAADKAEKAAKEAAEKAAKETAAKEAAEKGAKEAGEKGAREAAEKGAGKEAKEQAGKKVDDAVGAGRQVKQERQVADPLTGESHTVKVLSDGTVIRCSVCEEMAESMSKRADDVVKGLPDGPLTKKAEELAERANDLRKQGPSVVGTPDEAKWLDEMIKLEDEMLALERQASTARIAARDPSSLAKPLLDAGADPKLVEKAMEAGISPKQLNDIVGTMTDPRQMEKLVEYASNNAGAIRKFLDEGMNPDLVKKMMAEGFGPREIEAVAGFAPRLPVTAAPAPSNLYQYGAANMQHFLERHTLDHFDFAQIKNNQAFWPRGTTPTDIANHLQEALDIMRAKGIRLGHMQAVKVPLSNGIVAQVGASIQGGVLTIGQFYPFDGRGVGFFVKSEMEAILRVLTP
jgi:hypothetical protein